MDQFSFGVNPPPADDQMTRRPPANIEAEQALLGAIFLHNDAMDRVGDILRGHHFFEPLHGQIFEAMQRTIGAGKLATPVTLKTAFEGYPDINEDMTVPQYLGRLVTHATTVVGARDYAKTILDLATRRSLVIVGERLIESAFDSHTGASPDEMIEEAEQDLYKVADAGHQIAAETLGSGVKSVLTAALKAHETGVAELGLMTGFVDLDKRLGGLRDGNLIVLGARPSMGKTALALQIAFQIARRYVRQEAAAKEGKTLKYKGGKVAFFSLEMSTDELSARVLGIAAETCPSVIQRGCDGDLDRMEHVTRMAATLDAIPLYIDQTGGLSIARLSARARRMKRRHGLDLIIVDYLQLMSGGARKENRTQEITEITTGLKALAKELSVPIIALSQLNRELEKRADKRPQMSDLRESGSIEQDADVVLFIYRDEYYVEREKPPASDVLKYADWQSKMRDIAGLAEVICAKQRHGPVGTTEMTWEGHLTRFSDLAQAGAP